MVKSRFEQLISGFPYTTEINLASIISSWESKINSTDRYEALIAIELVKEYKSKPHLQGVVTQAAFQADDASFIKRLFGPFYSDGSPEEIFAAMSPFSDGYIFGSKGYEFALANIDLEDPMMSDSMIQQKINFKIMNAGAMILKKFYLPEFVQVHREAAIPIKDPQKSFSRYYQMQLRTDFTEVEAIKPLKKISKKELDELLEEPDNSSKWLSLFPPENFKFSGVVLIRFTDISRQQIISQLKDNLLSAESIISDRIIGSIGYKMSSLAQRCSLKVGIFPYEEGETLARYNQSLWKGLAINRETGLTCEDLADSFYQTVFSDKKILIVSDLKTIQPSLVRDKLMDTGIKSLYLAPLIDEGKFIGYLEIGAHEANGLDVFSTLYFEELLPLFAMAVSRFLEGLEDKVQAIIKQNCTAVHPAVEWKFNKAAIDYLDQSDKGLLTEMAPIVFEEVYPFYGLSDVRNSSKTRNACIKQDLVDQLKSAKRTLSVISKDRPLLAFDEIIYKIEQQLSQVQKGLQSGDEQTVREFFRREINAVLNDLELSKFPESQKALKGYFKQLDPELGVIYRKRKDFEESITFLNERISKYLDEQQIEAQKMYPHYYERFKTDGVDYNIYIGQSINPSEKFGKIFLRNMRLWQLKSMCGATMLAAKLKSEMKIPLDTAQLILAYATPMSVQFRYDEKKFDVNGAYNIRYEIIKKRIDKAYIAETKERLTQPGKIAIVFSHRDERAEYLRYISYLQSFGMIQNKIEEVDLEELPGAEGLKALRIKVNISEGFEEVDINELVKIVNTKA